MKKLLLTATLLVACAPALTLAAGRKLRPPRRIGRQTSRSRPDCNRPRDVGRRYPRFTGRQLGTV